MNPLLTWLLFYITPLAVAGAVAKLFPTEGNDVLSRDAFLVHAALAVSIVGSQYSLFMSGAHFPWSTHDPFVLLFLAAGFTAFLMLRALGFWYTLSAFFQQLCMLSMAYVLYPAYPLWAVVLFIVPIYTLAHLMKIHYSLSRLALFFGWGTMAVALFAFIPSIWLFTALHTLAGAALIRWGVLYPKTAIPKGFI